MADGPTHPLQATPERDLDLVAASGKVPEDIHERIDRLVRECSVKGWDSYDADPVQPKAAALAHIFANLLADKFVGPTYEGGLEFEWDTEDGATYLVSVHYLPKAVASGSSAAESQPTKT